MSNVTGIGSFAFFFTWPTLATQGILVFYRVGNIELFPRLILMYFWILALNLAG